MKAKQHGSIYRQGFEEVSSIFDWEEYRKLAEHLETNNLSDISEECRLRNVISRLYYFSFHRVMKFAEKKGFKNPGHGSHGALKAHLRKIKKVNFAEAVGAFQELREKCDYDDDLNETPKDILENAKEYMDQLRTLF